MWKFHCKGNMDFSFIFICRVSCSGRLISGRVLCSSSPPHADYPSVLLDLPMGYMPTASIATSERTPTSAGLTPTTMHSPFPVANKRANKRFQAEHPWRRNAVGMRGL